MIIFSTTQLIYYWGQIIIFRLQLNYPWKSHKYVAVYHRNYRDHMGLMSMLINSYIRLLHPDWLFMLYLVFDLYKQQAGQYCSVFYLWNPRLIIMAHNKQYLMRYITKHKSTSMWHSLQWILMPKCYPDSLNLAKHQYSRSVFRYNPNFRLMVCLMLIYWVFLIHMI
jgi:hypothetical protein